MSSDTPIADHGLIGDLQTAALVSGDGTGEVGQTGELLGNVPQAFTHLSLINAAIDLDRRLDEPPGAQLRAPVRT